MGWIWNNLMLLTQVSTHATVQPLVSLIHHNESCCSDQNKRSEFNGIRLLKTISYNLLSLYVLVEVDKELSTHLIPRKGMTSKQCILSIWIDHWVNDFIKIVMNIYIIRE